MTAESETTAQGYVPAANYRGQVEAMAGYGVPEGDIAKVLDINPETLRPHYRRELEASSVRINDQGRGEPLSQGHGGRPRGSPRGDLLAEDACSLEGDQRA